MTGLPCVSEELHCAAREVPVEERARAIMRYGRVRKMADRAAAEFRAELPDGAVYTVMIPLRRIFVDGHRDLFEPSSLVAIARDLVHSRLVEQLTAEGLR